MDSLSSLPSSTTPPTYISSEPSPQRMPAAIIAAGHALLPLLERGQKLDATVLRAAMRVATGGDDSDGKWLWKDAYTASEIALVLFLQKHLPAIEKHAQTPSKALEMLARVQALLATHTRRSEEGVRLQQFSTPLALAYLVERAAAVKPHDLVLEPSAGTGLLAVMADVRRASLMLNEICSIRAESLADLFPNAAFTRHNGECINDLLASGRPSVVLMNPPFSTSPTVKGRMAGIDARHVRSALQRLASNGRLIAITSEGFNPFETCKGHGTVLLSVALSGDFFKAHGTTIPTRLTVFDKAVRFTAASPRVGADTADELLRLIETHVPPRLDCQPDHSAGFAPTVITAAGRAVSKPAAAKTPPSMPAAGIALTYAVHADVKTCGQDSVQGIYEPYRVERISIPDAKPHPDKLVQSAAMASVSPPIPSYKPHVTENLIRDGILSDAQLETVIYAGEAHSELLKGHWLLDEQHENPTPAEPDHPQAVQFRRGYFIGDGTGVGKGRQVAAIILDNWLKGRKKALWISKSDALLEDAQRDWAALGMEKLLVTPLERFKQDKPITFNEGILFATYATLRSGDRNGAPARLKQILTWLGNDFDGVIVFDEAHAMANAAGGDSDRGWRKPSQQGLMGLRLQNAVPDARIVYVSATGATTVENLAYSQRLGLWGSSDMPFQTRDEFMAAMNEGGIAAMEVVARDLKALGLYTARSLTYEGITVDLLVHDLTPDQTRIYDEFAGAYQIIHANIEDALQATGITSPEHGTLNPRAKSAVRSAFEGNKVRFFANLLMSMKMPSLIASIQNDLARGDAALVQLITTSEALLERRLAEIPVDEWGDLSIDITPREYVLDYLKHSFPTKLYETHTDDKGNKYSVPMMVNGSMVECKEAVACRDALIERLQALPPLQSALDQLVQHFGTDRVAEVTGRSRRIVKKATQGGTLLAVETRSSGANLAETQAYMDDIKRILVFSEAGGTGRSYHAALDCKNQRQRRHYLLEPGWKADAAIQGLGRSNRTNQKQPPVFIPVTTNVKGERRFITTIARRLDSMGAITRGERKTGGQGLFRASDNLDTEYAWSARRTLFRLLVEGKVACCSYERFVAATGLNLTDRDGTLKEDLPPMHTLLNRMLALPIALQNDLFDVLEGLIQAKTDAAVAAGTFDVGLETITAESLSISKRHVIATHKAGTTTAVYEVLRRHKPKPLTVMDALAEQKYHKTARFLLNGKSMRAALEIPACSITLDDGRVQPRVKLLRPMESQNFDAGALEETYWLPCDATAFKDAWQTETNALPPFIDTAFHVMTGMLLPMWNRLPVKNPRVYRFVTDDGERVIGRLIPADTAAGLTGAVLSLNTTDAWAWLNGGGELTLQDGISIRKRLIMHAYRYELSGFNDSHAAWLKAQGCIGEIIGFRLRLFVPVGSEGPAVLARIMQRYPHCPASTGARP